MPSGENPRVRGVPKPLSGGPVKFGPYWLDARLAVGGTAEVYIGRPVDPAAMPRRLVVKRLLPQFAADPEGRTMFEREAALHAAVRHENVVQIYAYGVEGEEPWLAMELVDGCDLFRLLRRLSGEGRTLGPGPSVYLALELLRGLASAHGACDASGQPMGIIHRDVTPSNVYLSSDGRVKLGDFGIARSSSRATLRTTGGPGIKGKFAYLSPEQVAGEVFDQRSDLFSTAVVLSEMLLGRPLFDGGGQLAVLLAIRDCRIDSLREARASMPRGLFEVLERALARDPSKRFQTAVDLSAALAPFAAPSSAVGRAELAALVRWVQAAPSVEQMKAAREEPAAPRPGPPSPPAAPAETESERITGEYTALPSYVMTAAGERVGPWAFARLVEAIATGQVGPDDMVDYIGRGLAPLESIEELARFLPTLTATTNRLGGVGPPEFVDTMSVPSLVGVLLRAVESELTGVLFAEGPTESRALPKIAATGQGERGRKELYIVRGKLHHVASNNATELLGEYLVRRHVISREELDFALAVLPRYNGRMGDTLISLGLVSSLDIFRAIRDQGRDRLVDLFRWQSGELAFYAGQTARHVEFPLDLDIPPLIFAGIEAAQGEVKLDAWRERLDAVIGPPDGPRPRLHGAPWPPLARRLLTVADRPRPLRDVLAATAQGGAATASDALQALDVMLAAKLLVWR